MINLFSFLGDNLELDQDYIKVLHQLATLKISYPSELARETYLPREKIDLILKYYMREKAILRVDLNPEIVHPKLLPRLNYFWKKEVLGFKAFTKMNWVECNDEIYWGDKDFKKSKPTEETIS